MKFENGIGKTIKVLMEKLPARFIIQDGLNENPGIIYPNGTGMGILGKLANGEVDIASQDYSMTYERFNRVSFTAYLGYDRNAILSISRTNANKKQDVMNSIYQGIHKEVYICYGISVIVIAILCTIALYLSTRKAAGSQKQQTQASRLLIRRSFSCYCTIIRYILDLYGVTLTQSMNHLSSIHAIRILLASFLMAVFLIYTIFNIRITIDIVIAQPENNVERIEDLLKLPKMCPYIFNGASLSSMFQSTTDPTYVATWKRITQCNEDEGLLMTPVDNNISKIKNFPNRVYKKRLAVMITDFALLQLGSIMCQKFPNIQLHLSRTRFYSTVYALGINKNMDPHIRRLIDRHILQLHAGGIYRFWTKNTEVDDIFDDEAMRLSCFDKGKLKSEVQLISLESVLNLFVLWICGLSLSTVALVVEVIISKYWQ